MIDPRILRDEPDRVRASQAKRGLDSAVVDLALVADARRRAAIVEYEAKRAEQKQMGAQVAKATPEERPGLLARTKEVAAEVKALEETNREAEAAWDQALKSIPNVCDDATPAGGEDDSV